jgi:hypothetical protein
MKAENNTRMCVHCGHARHAESYCDSDECECGPDTHTERRAAMSAGKVTRPCQTFYWRDKELVPASDYDAISHQRDELREALRVGREVLAAVIGDIEDGFGFGDIRAKYIQTLLNARDGMDLALTNSRGGQ